MKLGKKVGKIIGKLCLAPSPRDNYKEMAFVTFVLRVDTEFGLQTKILKILQQHCRGLGFSMEEDGTVKVSGFTNPKKLMQKIGKCGKVKLEWFNAFPLHAARSGQNPRDKELISREAAS